MIAHDCSTVDQTQRRNGGLDLSEYGRFGSCLSEHQDAVLTDRHVAAAASDKEAGTHCIDTEESESAIIVQRRASTSPAPYQHLGL